MYYILPLYNHTENYILFYSKNTHVTNNLNNALVLKKITKSQTWSFRLHTIENDLKLQEIKLQDISNRLNNLENKIADCDILIAKLEISNYGNLD
jgi:hypothetical protein